MVSMKAALSPAFYEAQVFILAVWMFFSYS